MNLEASPDHLFAVAIFIFLPATAWTRIVSSWFSILRDRCMLLSLRLLHEIQFMG